MGQPAPPVTCAHTAVAPSPQAHFPQVPACGSRVHLPSEQPAYPPPCGLAIGLTGHSALGRENAHSGCRSCRGVCFPEGFAHEGGQAEPPVELKDQPGSRPDVRTSPREQEAEEKGSQVNWTLNVDPRGLPPGQGSSACGHTLSSGLRDTLCRGWGASVSRDGQSGGQRLGAACRLLAGVT